MKKINIVFDTNCLRKNSDEGIDIYNPSVIIPFTEKIKEDVELFITEVSIDELVRAYSKKVDNEIIKIKNILEKHCTLMNKVEIGNVDKQKVNLKEKLITFVKNKGFKIIPYPINYDISYVLERSINKIPPFQEKKDVDKKNIADAGFQDTMIFLSMVEFFKDKSKVILKFKTSDKGFHTNSDKLKKEFNDITKNQLEISTPNEREPDVFDYKNTNSQDFKIEIKMIESIVKEVILLISKQGFRVARNPIDVPTQNSKRVEFYAKDMFDESKGEKNYYVSTYVSDIKYKNIISKKIDKEFDSAEINVLVDCCISNKIYEDKFDSYDFNDIDYSDINNLGFNAWFYFFKTKKDYFYTSITLDFELTFSNNNVNTIVMILNGIRNDLTNFREYIKIK